MTVYFIGAGPGAPDLITIRGLKLIQQCKTCLYAGSLVPTEIVAEAPQGTTVMDTAAMHLDEIIGHIKDAHDKGHDVSRVHSGDPSIYGATAEQMRKLDELGIDYEIIPGVSAYAAMAAAMKKELTLADVSQTVIITRTSVRSSGMPKGEELAELGKSRATLAIHLSVNNLKNVIRDLTPHYGEDCPVAVGYRVSWADQEFVYGTLSTIRDKVKKAGFTRTALIMVGEVLNTENFNDSKLYDADHWHVCRDEQEKGK
ncbi:MAG: precorrin-4 C(11)-methyltransferase [Alphaproteobacteria bacterium]